VNQKPKILVVDDEPSICWGFDRMLRDDGYEVLTASSAEAGLKLAAQHPIALVLLDVRLPGEDGLTALPKFREVTGGADRGDDGIW
jgi:two-component system nitrogen regulation response regulator GlnG